VPSWAERIIGEVAAQPIYFRLESDYEGEIDFGSDVMKVSGDTIIEYMIFNLRRGQVPEEVEYRHFLEPPKLAGLNSAR
jgi:hypothetical protein